MMPQNNGEENITLTDLLHEIKNSKDEVKNCIAATEVRLRLEIQELKNKNETLEKEKEISKERLERTEQFCNKNNIVIFGLNKGGPLKADYLCSEINRILDVQIEPEEINDYYTLGKKDNSPIKIEFISYQSKKIIFERIKKLKGTGVAIANDLTLRQRQDLQKLKTFLRKARTKYADRSFLKGNKLIIGEEANTLEELERFGLERNKTRSAPNTPSINSESDYVREEIPTTSTSKEVPREITAKEEINEARKFHNTPRLPTHKKGFFNKNSSKPEKIVGMTLRHKSTSERKN